MSAPITIYFRFQHQTILDDASPGPHVRFFGEGSQSKASLIFFSTKVSSSSCSNISFAFSIFEWEWLRSMHIHCHKSINLLPTTTYLQTNERKILNLSCFPTQGAITYAWANDIEQDGLRPLG